MALTCFEVIFSFIKTNSPPEFAVLSSRIDALNPGSENWFFGKVSTFCYQWKVIHVEKSLN